MMLPFLTRPLRRLRSAGLALLLLPVLAAPVAAAESGGVFDLYLKGIRAATLSFSGEETGARYAASGRLESAGIVSLIRTMRYDATVAGTVGDGRFRPGRYTEDADTGRRQSSAVMSYKGGVPQVASYSPPREPRERDVAPQTQGGTIDPMTAIFIGLRDTPRERVCDYDSFMFDGRRRSRVTLASPVAKGEQILCSGRYQRIAGFSDGEMAEKTDFQFTLTYAPVGEGMMRVGEIAMDTIYGRARLMRR